MGRNRYISKILYNPCVSEGAPRAPRGTSQKPLYSLCFWRGASGALRRLSKTFIFLVFLEVRLGRPEVPLKTLYIPCVSGGAPRAPQGASQNPLQSLCFWRDTSGAPRCLSQSFVVLVFLEGRLGRPGEPLKNLYHPCVSGGAPRAPRDASQTPLSSLFFWWGAIKSHQKPI